MAKDSVAARQYFETAANLGDTDAMNEAAWCYLEGFGGKKDKVSVTPYSPHSSFVSPTILFYRSDAIAISFWLPSTTGLPKRKEIN